MVDGPMSKVEGRIEAVSKAACAGVAGFRHGRSIVAREKDFALLYATGKPFPGNCGCRTSAIFADNARDCPVTPTAGQVSSGGVMDLAMAMGVALFGMFAASTVYFFHKLDR